MIQEKIASLCLINCVMAHANDICKVKLIAITENNVYYVLLETTCHCKQSPINSLHLYILIFKSIGTK